VLSDFFLKGCHPLKLTNISIHVKQEVELGHLRDIALNVEGTNLRIKTRGKIVNKHPSHVAMKIGRSRMGGERVIISNKEETLILVLHSQEIAHSTKIISKVKFTSWSNSTNNYIHVAKINKNILIKKTRRTNNERRVDRKIWSNNNFTNGLKPNFIVFQIIEVIFKEVESRVTGNCDPLFKLEIPFHSDRRNAFSKVSI